LPESSGFPDRLKKARESKGLRPVDLARQVRLDLSYIVRLEAGERAPSDRTLHDLAEALAIRLDWLRAGEGEMYAAAQEAEAPDDPHADLLGLLRDGLGLYHRVLQLPKGLQEDYTKRTREITARVERELDEYLRLLEGEAEKMKGGKRRP
jgi:transcriptional regulator with XRE-family HTH domain